MKKLFISALLLLCTHPMYALLSPLNQSIEELRAIVQSTALTEYLPQSDPIMEIHKASNGYIIVTKTTEMSVEVQMIKTTQPGPQQFKLIFHEPVKLEEKS